MKHKHRTKQQKINAQKRNKQRLIKIQEINHLNEEIQSILIKHTNDICFGTLLGYAISIITRTLITDILIYKKKY